MKHSKVVGGSTAKRVINCPASVAMCAAMPPKASSSYADEGTLLHNVIADVLGKDVNPISLIGVAEYNGIEFSQELYDTKLAPALGLLKELGPIEFEVEQQVAFDEGIFGSVDLIGRVGKRVIILDWKFGSGVAVEAKENEQGLFYAAAARMTPSTQWAFEGAEEVEIVIIQPPSIKRWATDFKRLDKFQYQLMQAVKKPNAPLSAGDHCQWCAAKPVCPKFTGAVERAIAIQMESLDAAKIGAYLKNVELLEQWITDLRALAASMLEKSVEVPGWKLVAKRSTRSWADEAAAKSELLSAFPESAVMVSKLVSPAQAEKLTKKIPATVSISSGTSIAPESDPRPAVVQIGQQMVAALSKLR